MAQRGDERLSLIERISYGCGDFGYSLAYNMASAFLLLYYTNVALLPPAAVGTLFLTARLLDAVFDLGVGVMVDKTRTRWGRTRPYFLFTALPYVCVFVLCFMVPDWGVNAKLVWAFVTFNLLGLLMSLGSIPYTALMPMMTLDTTERMRLGSARSIGTSVSVILGTAATMPLVGLFGAGNQARGFLLVALLYAALSLLALTLIFRNCKERHEDQTPANFPVFNAVGEMLRNRAWWVTFIFTLLYFIRFGAMISVTAFFAIDVLQKPWMISILLPAISGMLLLAAFFAPPILGRLGIKRGCLAALILAVGLYTLMPLAEASPPIFVGLYLLASLAACITITGIFTMAAECVDYHEVKFNSRNEGLLSSGISLATKIGMAIGTAAIAFTLAASGYKPTAVTESARAAIRLSYYGWPILLLSAQAICILFWPMKSQAQNHLEAALPVK